VQAGVSTGSRSYPCFGWARNLEEDYDETEERDLCSLFSLNYAPVRGQLPAVARLYEAAIEASDDLPRLDKEGSREF
jgi:hypothetical protein